MGWPRTNDQRFRRIFEHPIRSKTASIKLGSETFVQHVLVVEDLPIEAL